jgi:hypothetical protein
MQHFTDLQFRWVAQKDRPYYVVSTSRSSDLSVLFPILTSLTVTNPTPLDRCYARLPPSPKHLFLPAVCPRDEHGTGILLSDAQAIIRFITAGPAMLVALQFNLKCFTPLEIIRDIALGLPMLQTLEIGNM